MGEIRYLLSKYFEILEENRTAKYLHGKHITVTFINSETSDDLWKIHDEAIENFKIKDIKPKQSLFDLKLKISDRIFKKCCFCERRCEIDRTKKTGNCGVLKPAISSEFLHIGEERVLVPSHTIFFSGCSFHCVFCQNWDISQTNAG